MSVNMTSTRSGGAPRDGTPGSSASAAIGDAARRETRSASAVATTNLRRSTRETKGKRKSDLATSPSPSKRSTRATGNTPEKKLQGESTPSTRKAATPAPKQDSDTGNTTAKGKNGGQKDNLRDSQSVGSLSKKRKRLSSKHYVALFTEPKQRSESPPGLASPNREDVEKASKARAEDNDTDLVCLQNVACEQVNQEPSTVASDKLLEHQSSGLHDTPEAILERDKLKIGCHHSEVISESHMSVQVCSLNKADEGTPMMEGGEQTDGYSNQSSLPELPNGPCSASHHKEADKPTEDVGVQGACSPTQTEAFQYDETDHNDLVCVACKSGSISDILKCCDGKGCKQHYHLSCIVPPLEHVPLGIWLCITCTKKRIQFGVYSVSDGIDSLWDIKDGPQSSKQYFVKYKNLAHAHNQWVSESDLVDSTPQGRDLISKFNKKILKDKTIRWKQEWAEPHRLLKKRSLMLPEEAEVFFNSLGDKFAFCNTEWLVKWKDLGYEHATWELETSSFLCTPEAEELKRRYESRHKAAGRASGCGKLNKAKEGVFQKVQRLPDGVPPGLDDDHSINQLRDFWHKSLGAIFIDDQERIIKTILFVKSILPDVTRPLLIVSTSASLSVWEAKFSRLAASINVVVYNGETNLRKTIQDLEFYDNGSMMLQVLLSHPDAILEDIEDMERISWEVVLVDDCQSSRVSKCLDQLKRLPTNFRMVLLSSPIKENILEYINMLSFLNPEENDILSVPNDDSSDKAVTLAVLKAKLACHIASERKADSSIFSEYWVPAPLPLVQLEMYCYTILSNSAALRSHSKTDSVDALRNILVSLRKCCDHPYLVDQSLQSSLTEGHPLTKMVDIGVDSCGKLLLLDKMLQELRTEGLRVLILCQSGGGSANPMGDILDDFVRHRFGYESYERVERGLVVQKRQRSMNMFNDKKKGRFIFLMDSRACVPSIKLSSIDAVIIYSSDWNPVNDLRALQRISIESKSEHVPVFRLYSSCTVEEKALILAKHDQILDSNIQNITPCLIHCLLSWGASFLFNRLEKLHNQNHNYSSQVSDGDKLFLDNVISEFSTKLPTKVEVSTERDNFFISQAHLCGSFYSRHTVVVGEREGISSPDSGLPNFWAYWSNLLPGRSPPWQYISETAQRSRRKIQNMEEPSVNTQEGSKVPAGKTDDTRMKRRKLVGIMESSAKVPQDGNKDAPFPQSNASYSSHQIPVDDTWQELETINLHGAQSVLHVQLKPELSKLYQLLELPESVKSLCEEFLEYILKNHQVSSEPKDLLHAFNIALCWRAASLLKHKVNRRESLALAVKNLNYRCCEERVLFVYEKLRILKKKFAHRAGKTRNQSQSTSTSNILPHEPETSKSRNDDSICSQAISVNGGFENGSHQDAPGDLWTEEIVSGEKELLCDTETRQGEHLSRDELLSMEKRIEIVEKVFSERNKSIQDKHSKEVSLLDVHKQREITKLRGACTLVVKHLRKNRNNEEDMVGKIRLIMEWFTMLLYAFLEHMRCQRNKLDMKHLAAWTKESQLKEQFLQAAKSGQLDSNFYLHIPLPESDFVVEEFSHFREEIGSCSVHSASLTPQSLDDNSAMEITLARGVNASEVSTTEVVRNGAAEVLVQRSQSEMVGLTVNRIHHNISDGIDSLGDVSLTLQPSANKNHSIDDSANQEPSGGNQISTVDVEEENSAISLLQGGTSQHLGDAEMEVNTESSEARIVSHLQIPASTALSSHDMLPVSREVEGQRNIVSQSAQQDLTPSQLPQDEQGQESLAGIVSAQSFQPEGQSSIPDPESSNPPETAQGGPQDEQGQEGLAGIVSAQSFQPEGQPSIPDPEPSNPPETAQGGPQDEQGQEGLAGIVSAQSFQPEGQPSIPDPEPSNPPETAQADQSQTSQTDSAPNFVQSTQLALMMFNHPPIYDQPLKNEMHKIRLLKEKKTNEHELKKSQLRMECNQELEKLKQKYELLIEEYELAHIQLQNTLDDMYEKVHRHQSLAEDFQTKFISSPSTQARQTAQASQQAPTRPSLAGSSASPVASSSACRPPVRSPLAGSSALPVASSSACRPPVLSLSLAGSSASPVASSLAGSSASPVASSSACQPPVRSPSLLAGSSASPVSSPSACRLPAPSPRVQLPQVDRPTSSLPHMSRPPLLSSQVSQPAPLVPGNHFRATSVPVGHLPTPRGSYGVHGESAPRPRAPAPHLQFRRPRLHPMPPGNQQQVPRLEVTSSSSRTQLSPVAQGTSLLSSSQPTLLADPSTSGSHQPFLATSVMSNSHSALPTTSSPSSSLPVPPASSPAPSSSANHPAHHVPPTPNPASLATAPCTTAAASSTPVVSRRMGPVMEAVVQSTDAGSQSFDAWLTSNIGLSSGSSPATGGVVDVVCLSDDDSN